MSTKTPSERFLMTLPKPIYDQMAEEAEKLGVTVQDRIRTHLEKLLESLKMLYEMGEELTKHQEHSKIIDNPQLEKHCYEIGKKIYDEYAIERRRLTITRVRDEAGWLYTDYIESDPPIVLPVIQKTFRPFDYEVEGDECLSIVTIGKAAKAVAETENQILAICEDGDIVYEGLPFQCKVWGKNGIWEGMFRLVLNSARTPTLSDVLRVTS